MTGAGEDGYMACSIYVEHGACSCSTGVPGNVCPLAEAREIARWIEEGNLDD